MPDRSFRIALAPLAAALALLPMLILGGLATRREPSPRAPTRATRLAS